MSLRNVTYHISLCNTYKSGSINSYNKELFSIDLGFTNQKYHCRMTSTHLLILLNVPKRVSRKK